MKQQSKVITCSDYRWDTVPRKVYKEEGKGCFKGVHRYSLVGEGDDEQQLNFQTRYFEISPGGYTSFEYHRHPHSVVIIRGRGEVILGNEVHPIGLHDVVYIGPETPHQFHAGNEEPLGFICIVDRYRDRPTLPDDEFVEKEITSDDVRDKIRR